MLAEQLRLCGRDVTNSLEPFPPHYAQQIRGHRQTPPSKETSAASCGRATAAFPRQLPLLPWHQDPVTQPQPPLFSPQLSFGLDPILPQPPPAKQAGGRTSCAPRWRRGPAHAHPQPHLPASILFSDTHLLLPASPCKPLVLVPALADVRLHRL